MIDLSAQQLMLPFAGEKESWSVAAAGARHFELELALHERGVRVVLDAFDPTTDQRLSWQAAIDATPPRPRATLPVSITPGGLTLEPRIGHDEGDVLARPLIYLAAMSRNWPAAKLQEVRDALARVAAHLSASLEADATLAAMAFPPRHGLRWEAYALGCLGGHRMCQALAVCPSLALVAHGCRARGAEDAFAPVLEAVVEGRRLRDVLDRAVRAWARVEGRAGGLSPEEHRAHRLRFRRAPARLSPRVLWAPPAVGGAVLIPEDIPESPAGAVHWYTALAAPGLRRHGDELVSEAQREALTRFVSRHAPTLCTYAENSTEGDVETLIVDFIHQVWDDPRGHVPSRRADPVTVIDRSVWWRIRGPGRPRLPLATPLLLGPLESVRAWPEIDGLTYDVLKTVAAATRWAAKQHNCLASLCQLGTIGRAVFLALSFEDGDEATVALADKEGRLEIVEAAGPCNSPMEREKWQKVLVLVAAFEAARENDTDAA